MLPLYCHHATVNAKLYVCTKILQLKYMNVGFMGCFSKRLFFLNFFLFETWQEMVKSLYIFFPLMLCKHLMLVMAAIKCPSTSIADDRRKKCQYVCFSFFFIFVIAFSPSTSLDVWCRKMLHIEKKK